MTCRSGLARCSCEHSWWESTYLHSRWSSCLHPRRLPLPPRGHTAPAAPPRPRCPAAGRRPAPLGPCSRRHLNGQHITDVGMASSPLLMSKMVMCYMQEWSPVSHCGVRACQLTCRIMDRGLLGLPDLEPARPPKYMRKRSPAFQMRCIPLSKASDRTRKSGNACTISVRRCVRSLL